MSTTAAVPLLTGETSRRSRSSRRMLSEQSLLVRQTAARQIEERRSRWAYSPPIVIIDLIFNAAIVLIAGFVMQLSKDEVAEVPVRVWIVGYCVLCGLHMVSVCVEVRRRRREVLHGTVASFRSNLSSSSSLASSLGSRSSLMTDFVDFNPQRRENEDDTSLASHMEAANRIFSFMWWIIGFYWISSGGETLADNAPNLYRLTSVFLIFDVIIVVICVLVACIVGIAVCCCLPVIIAVIYAVSDQEGASTEEIARVTTNYRFRQLAQVEDHSNDEIEHLDGGIMTECNTDTPIEKTLPRADAACSICIEEYDNESEIRELPCLHHFHSACVDKWLRSKPTCPLCVKNILGDDDQSSSDHV